MMKTFEIKIDVEKDIYSPSQLFTISGFDVDSIEIQFEITQDDAPFDLTGRTVELAIKKPSGMTVYQDVEIISGTEGKASAILSVQGYVEIGVHSAELYISLLEQMIVTSPFYYICREAIMGTEDVESSHEWTALQKVLYTYDKKPILTEGVPTSVPEYVGQTAFDYVNKIFFLANDTTADSWVAVGSGGDATVVSWDTILNKPLTFPSDPHLHEILDVNGLQLALDGKTDVGHIHEIYDVDGLPNMLDTKADVFHSHPISDVTNLQLTLDGKADDVHTHAIADVTGLQLALDGKVDDAEMTNKADVNHTHNFASITEKPLTYPPDVHSHTYASLTEKPTTFPPSAHVHAIADVTNLQTTLNGKMNTGDAYLKTETYRKTEVYNKAEVDQMTMDSGGSTVIVEDNLESTSTANALSSNQGRILNEAKANINHIHPISEVDGLQLALDGKVDDAELDGKANTIHTHAIADVTNLQDTLNGLDKKPIIGTVAPTTVIPEYIGQMYLNTATQDAYISHGTTSGAWVFINEEIPVAWADITEKPTTFPPEAHGHTFAEITEKPLTYPPDVHSHAYADITAKPTSFPPDVHTHAIADVTNLQISLDGKADDVHAHTFASITEKPISYPPEAHTHTKADITDFAHNHTSADITDFGMAVAGAIPPEYLTETEGDTRYQASGIVPAHTHDENDVTFATKNAKVYVDDADNYIINTLLGGLTMVKLTQASYNAIATKDPNTIYFIVG